jgi:flagellar assembly protein FliH
VAVSKIADNVLPFVYRPAPGWRAAQASAGAAAAGVAGGALETAAALAAAPAGPGALEERLRVAQQQGWDDGLKEGMLRARAEAEAAMLQQREAIASALREFGQARAEYFHRVEGEVVALALAVVRKILRREAQVDPMLLSGLVRVALEKMAAGHTVRMRVHPSQIAAWREHFAAQTDLAVLPELSGDTTLEQNRCQLETELGVTDISLETQLKEIEQGLFDLLAQRPTPQ